ncbi:MAG: glycoside hydrolase family 130 protein [Planctomycetota bacterium]
MTAAPTLQVRRVPTRFEADDGRVIIRPFRAGGDDRARKILRRIFALSPQDVRAELDRVLQDFAGRHRAVSDAFLRHFGDVAPLMPDGVQASDDQQLLIGAYFSMEYAIESAALFNPSIVPHPDQTGLPEGRLRFIMSLRATGEGHVSSIVFRTGVVGPHGEIDFDPSPQYSSAMRAHTDRFFDKNLFFYKLIEMGAYADNARLVLQRLGDRFTLGELNDAIGQAQQDPQSDHTFHEAAANMRWLAQSNYELVFPPNAEPAEVVIFPSSENESRGIEDARLTRLIDDDGQASYFGTYTAYNGVRVLPQIFETRDFRTIQVHTLNGRYVQNKGMALFPRKIDGFYWMISRLDGENMFAMKSDNVHFWNEAELLCEPVYPWEFVQIGNCGPPIETPEGWLLLTHGVGPVRRYCIGALLLDLDDPTRVIGHLPEPLIAPREDERDGYVPNVVYSCGALAHAGHLILPYAVSDSATTVATVELQPLLNALVASGPMPTSNVGNDKPVPPAEKGQQGPRRRKSD